MRPAPGDITGLFAGMAVLVLLMVLSIGTGSSDISWSAMIEALRDPGDTRADLVVWQVRLPRVLAAIGAGAALAVAGAIMQAVTGNPLAEPGLMGVNAGAAFAVVIALSAFEVTASGTLTFVAMIGAGCAAALVYSLGAAGRSGPTPIKLILAGVIAATFLGAVTNAILLFDAQTLDTVRFWTVGSVRGRDLGQVVAVLPWIALAVSVALGLGRQFTTLSLGESARGLGQNLKAWRGIAAALVAALAGGAVAMAGPLAFVGLVVPHITRMIVGPDYARILPFSAVGGAALVLAADTAPRAILAVDLPAGVATALIGAPFFVWLARRHGVDRG
ncbi:hypothetical protein OCH239_10590 [Roseivivax halodurans JCM 10272]|uniref:Iron ABC transporter permease n=1 Tax=Roseivivax halodurans JCM 10272 TaxID=1449350 RepID=X7EE24_9RHOB|nr:iron ABC transporter permease [Roseivivax halodurans]ETX13421.1 hypothetical protein OCH239_10590 [Roseivivax halodurans JCM 10272]